MAQTLGELIEAFHISNCFPAWKRSGRQAMEHVEAILQVNLARDRITRSGAQSSPLRWGKHHSGFFGGERFGAGARPDLGLAARILSVATSIDALAVGVSLALIGTSIAMAAIAVGVTAAGFTLTGMLLGRRIGQLWGRRMGVRRHYSDCYWLTIVWRHMAA